MGDSSLGAALVRAPAASQGGPGPVPQPKPRSAPPFHVSPHGYGCPSVHHLPLRARMVALAVHQAGGHRWRLPGLRVRAAIMEKEK